MKLCLISDTHNHHEKIQLPEADILIHAGDFTNRGTLQESAAFFNWFGDQKQFKARICIAGNHEILSQKDPNLFKSCIPSNVTYLRDSGIEFEGLKIYGTPWQPFFYDWAWNGLEDRPGKGLAYEGGPGKGLAYVGGPGKGLAYVGGPGKGAQPDRDHPLLEEVYGRIPDDTQILICHGPPRYGKLDQTGHTKVGSITLMDRIQKLYELELVVAGHCHDGYGIENYHGIRLVNAALCDEFNGLVKQPIVVEI